MGTIGTADSLTELAQMLELFFKGLTECGLLTTYSVQLQATAVNFAQQMKFQLILQEFVTSLQKLLQKLLQKAPVPDSSENNHDVEVQTVENAENEENDAGKEEFLELKMTPTVTGASAQLGSLVENCIFAERQNAVEWVGDGPGSTDGLKPEIGANLMNENKTMGVATTDIIVTCQCHPSTLATISNQSFIATPLCEAVIATTPVKEANMVLMKQSHSPNNISNCTTVGLEQHSPSTVQETVTCETTNNYLQVATSTSPIEMKSFISTNSTAELPRVTFSSGQVSEPLVLESYEQGHCESISCITTAPNVMHIVLAETAKPVSIGNIEVTEPKKDDGLTSSEKSSDANQVQYTCEVCERTFRSSVSLEVHLSVKHRSRGECDICHQKFTSVLSLQEHCHAEHEGAGCFACMTCGRRFMTKLSYQRHVDTHKGKKGAVCDMCGKTFSRTDYLQKHYMTHTGHRPYRCQLCPKQFVSSSQLKVHQRIHTGEKEHVCEICKKAFSRGDKLKEHMMRHLNIKRFQCNHCSRDYAEKRDLTKHLKVHNTT